MDVPFHRVKVCGDILVAARGASIHTFDALNGAHVAIWRMPRPAGKDDECDSKKNGNGSASPAVDASATPPPKRRRLESAAVADAGRASQDSQDAPSSQKDSKTKKNKKGAAAAAVTAALRSGDLPVVSILESTADGRHVIVVMGHDKTVRVLSHDLQGHLEQISQRTVPKRPSAVAITADGQTILVGDKFGDVYALPLIETEESRNNAVTIAAERSDTPAAATALAASATTTATTTTNTITTPLQLKANSFTVHTKGNLQALENQRRQKELNTQQQSKQNPHDATDCRLLLGHVSMLTAVAVAEAVPADARPGCADSSSSRQHHRRPLILTADRDEHIRVTRGVIGTSPQTSQTHVIETFCLGHKSFVSRMCVAARRPDRLVSAGGDGELRVWDFWPSGQTVGAAALGPLVEATVAEEKDGGEGSPAPRVAVSGLYSFAESSAGDLHAATSSIVVICERVPALFFFVLEADGNTMTHTQTLRLQGLPLDVGIFASGGQARLIVAVATAEAATGGDTNASASLLRVARGDVQSPWTVGDARLGAVPEEAEHNDADVDPVALRHLLLFGTESLRKTDEEAGGE